MEQGFRHHHNQKMDQQPPISSLKPRHTSNAMNAVKHCMTAFAHESKPSKYNHKPLTFSHLTLTAQLLGRVAPEHQSAFLV
jgi:hypothetical protein